MRNALLLLVLALAGCDELGPRVYTAQAYDPEGLCLMPYAPIALVEAKELRATCAPRCLRYQDVLYVSSVCAPYPTDAAPELPEASADCGLALQSLEKGAFCGAPEGDAGVDGTEAPGAAGPDTEGPDAGVPSSNNPDPGGASDAGNP